jgi:hypothetical protein
MSVDELAGWTSSAANVTTPTSLIFSENRGMVSLDTIRASNIQAGNLENLVAVFGMLFLVVACLSFAVLISWSCHLSHADFCSILSSWRYEWSRRKHYKGIVLKDDDTASVHHRQVSLSYTIIVICCVFLTPIFRSQDKAGSLCKELEDTNPGSQAIFIKKDISVLKNVDEVCEELQRREKKINVLFLSAGYMSLSGRKGKSASLAGI